MGAVGVGTKCIKISISVLYCLCLNNKSTEYSNFIFFCSQSFQTTAHLRHNINKDDENLKTSVNFITNPKEKPSKQRPTFVSRYGPKGFVVQGSRVVGSLVILPGLLLHWKVSYLIFKLWKFIRDLYN